MNTHALIKELKSTETDFEWYPTTDEIIAQIAHDINGREYQNKYSTILDIGAGDGRVLSKINEQCDCFTDLYAIEKAKTLINAMNKDIVIIGTELYDQSLIDKDVDVIFCNPPYSEYTSWMEKIIAEAYSSVIYFVVPDRWENHKDIKGIMANRDATYKTLGNYNFLNADRQARANVSLIKIVLKDGYRKNDPFDVFFEQEFACLLETKPTGRETQAQKLKNSLVSGKNLIDTLGELYDNDMSRLHKNFGAIKSLDYSIFQSLDINIDNIKKALRSKIKNCKTLYWNELFSRLDTITNRLCSKQRDMLLKRIQKHNTLDFTKQNAYAIVTWIIKNANSYYDEQLADVYKDLLDPDSARNYKSNKVFTGEKDFMYSRWDYKNNVRDVYLRTDYRIVIDCRNTFDGYEYEKINGLKKYAADKIEDIFTVAKNLGYDILDTTRTCSEWIPGELKTFMMRHNDEIVEFATVRAYKNGNIHLKLNQEFMRKWNIEAGRILGWLKSPKYAQDEMGETDAHAFWNNNYNLKSVKLLT